MAKHIILEVRGLTRTAKNPNKGVLDRISSETGQPITTVEEQDSAANTSSTSAKVSTAIGSRAARQYFKAQQNYQLDSSQVEANLEELTSIQINDAQAEINAKHMVNIANADSKGNSNLEKEGADRLKKNTAVLTATLHYGKQAYDLYAQHQQNTYSMAGLTTAGIKLTQQQQRLNLINKGVGVGVAFAINPLLGGVQLAMTMAQQAYDYMEKQRRFQHELQKQNYSTNYYRSRLVRNNKVLI